MTRPTKTIHDKKALDIIKRGVDLIYEPVRRTLGPECGTTLMYRTMNRGPRNVDDGYYTAEVITPKDEAVRLATDFFKEGIKRTNQKVGDGTSTTCTIAGALFHDIYNRMYESTSGIALSIAGKENKKSPMSFKREILLTAKDIKAKIRAQAIEVTKLEELERIAAISLGEESELSKKIAEMSWELGPNNSIDVVEGYKGEVEFETEKGMSFPAKVCGAVFVNKPERFEMIIEEAPVIITDYKFDNPVILQKLVERLVTPKLAIIAPDFSDEVLVMMALSRKNGVFLWPVKVPALRTDQFEDVATYCGAKFIKKAEGGRLEAITNADLGYFEKLIVKDTEAREDADMRGGKGTEEAITARIKELEGKLAETREDQYKKLMERRIASLSSAKGTIRVGSPTDAETLPLKMKIEDVVYACKAALRGGYVKGGGLCLLEIANDLPNDHILKAALIQPHKQIMENAGRELEIDEDVIDPADAVYYAVEHATSVVASLITVRNLIPEVEDPLMGEGEYAIARSLNEIAAAQKIHYGQLKEGEEEMWKDARNGLSIDEMVTLDNG